MGEKNFLASVPDKRMPERERTLLQQIYDATNGGFGFADALDAYGKRARKLRTEAFDTLDSSTVPGIDPFIGAGRKALGSVQLLAHPLMALAPSPEEMQQRAIDAGNPEWAGVGWSLGNLVNLPSPSDSATVLATLGKGLAATKGAASLVAPVAAMAPIIKGADEGVGIAEDVEGPITRTMDISKALGGKGRAPVEYTTQQITRGAKDILRQAFNEGTPPDQIVENLQNIIDTATHTGLKRMAPMYQAAIEMVKNGVRYEPEVPRVVTDASASHSIPDESSIVRTLHQTKSFGRQE